MRFPTLTLGVLLAAAVSAGSACGKGGSSAPKADAGLPPLESQPPALIPAASELDATSTPIVFDTLRGGVWTANGDVGSISYVDVDVFKVVGETPIGKDIRSVALSPDKAWVAAVDRGGGTVALVDAYTSVVARTIPVGSHPRAAVWNASNPRWLYVAVEDEDAVAVIDRTLGVLAATIPVGRLPSGLAVSRKRNELYVSHRIDAKISIVDLAQSMLVDDVPLADQPSESDPTVPNGKPFAFEGIAWQPDGDIAWVPHELLAPTHPIQFQTTVFPAISVVDFSKRAEVVTNPNTGETLGRKLLFDAIDILDPQGNPSIVSQPCAIAQHPNAIAVYALMCGSEDLLTFDATQGVAVNLTRNLPGDHPVGITLDATYLPDGGVLSQRAFIVNDQSHTLLALDIAGGSPVAQPTVIGGTPLSLVAKDPVDPQLRAGQTLFFSANGLSRNPLATTGDNWMACGACHLDGFGSGEKVLFEAARIADPTSDARIGHVGLVDLFSTAPTPASPTFNPHDILVALLDQGGLAPDRTGAIRTGAVDPSMPPAAAVAMATQLAYVVARDLPVGPSWLSSTGAPNVMNDTMYCGGCHAKEYAAWQLSAHSHAGSDPMVRYCLGVEEQAVGPQYARLCAGCHDPTDARTGDFSLTSGRGVTCLTCHEADYPIRAGGNGDLVDVPYDWTVAHKERASAALPALRQPEFCGGCHAQFVPGGGLAAIETLDEWKASSFAGAPVVFPDGGLPDKDAGALPGEGGGAALPDGDAGPDGAASLISSRDAPVDAGANVADAGATLCVDCHMTVSGGAADHRFPGGNVYIASALGSGTMVPTLTANLQKAIRLSAREAGGGYLVTVSNVGAGHSFPTGVTDIREPWVEIQALDAKKSVLLHVGGPDANNLIPASAARFGTDIAQADGTLLLHHELTRAVSIPFDRRIPAGAKVDVFIPGPAILPAGTTEVDAVLYYRNVRTTYYRAATGNAAGTAPQVEVARVVVP